MALKNVTSTAIVVLGVVISEEFACLGNPLSLRSLPKKNLLKTRQGKKNSLYYWIVAKVSVCFVFYEGRKANLDTTSQRRTGSPWQKKRISASKSRGNWSQAKVAKVD